MLNPQSVAAIAEQEAACWQAASAASTHSDSERRIDSAFLLQGGRELRIAHAGEEYRLRLTRNDKLILTK
jgi:hemin uptake protein HemP